MNKTRFTSEEDIEELNSVIKLVEYGAISLRVGASILKARTGKPISHEGLRKIIINGRIEYEEEGLGDQSPVLPDGQEPGVHSEEGWESEEEGWEEAG